MKKLLSSLVALAMILSTAIMPAHALGDNPLKDTVVFSLNTAEATPDSDVNITLSLDGEYAATALTVFVDYDAELLTVKGNLKKVMYGNNIKRRMLAASCV